MPVVTRNQAQSPVQSHVIEEKDELSEETPEAKQSEESEEEDSAEDMEISDSDGTSEGVEVPEPESAEAENAAVGETTEEHDSDVPEWEYDPNEAEWELIGDGNNEGPTLEKHDLSTAPIFLRDAYLHTDTHEDIDQYGVLGNILQIRDRDESHQPADPRLYMNTNAPFSAIVCGVQGSGKSHTVSVMLENMLLCDYSPIGNLKKSLAGLVLHYGEGGPSALPSEAAWLSKSTKPQDVVGPPVHVYVSPSSLKTMRRIYERFGSRVTVEPLYFHDSELDASAIKSLMAVGTSDSAPLYMQIVASILRDLGEEFTFAQFMRRLDETKTKFNPSQLTGLEQRMSLLRQFLHPESYQPWPGTAHYKSPPVRSARFREGQLTIIDLSDPFVDPMFACGLFEIVLRLFIRADVQTGKFVLVDEAHKYLSGEKSTNGPLTQALLSLIRQQRHLAMRVIISTQEPTVVPPVLLDLCSMAIIHRFSSPTWWKHLVSHVPTNFDENDAFDEVVKLQTGQALILAPSGLLVLPTAEDKIVKSDSKPESPGKVLAQFGRRYIIAKTRRRVTEDGGGSILVLTN